MIRILLVDDHAVVRSGLALLLGAKADMEVVGEAAEGEKQLRKHCSIFPMSCLWI